MRIITNNDLLQFLELHPIINSKDIVIPKYSNTNLHNHCDSEIWHIKSGIGLLHSNEQVLPIKENDIIKFEPFDFHYLINSNDIPFVFTTYWFIDNDEIEQWSIQKLRDNNSLIIGTALPTPNGKLHLGHIAGPYLSAYITQKYYEVLNCPTITYGGVFGHLNHIDRTANMLGSTYANLVAKSSSYIIEDFNSLGINYDHFLSHYEYDINPEFQILAKDLFAKIQKSGYLISKTVMQPVDKDGNFLSESYISGNCPNCNSITIALECENCGLFQDETQIINPFHSDDKYLLCFKEVTKLYLKIDQEFIKRFIVKLYNDNSINAHNLSVITKHYHDNNFLGEIPITTFRNRGIEIYKGQMAAAPFERALRSYAMINNSNIHIEKHQFFCGLDNLCASGIFVPYILYLAGVRENLLPIVSISNLYLLEGKKFSTSRNHAVWLSEFSKKNPIDIIRFYLAKTAPQLYSGNFDYNDFINSSKQVITKISKIIEFTHNLLTTQSLDVIESGTWTDSDIVFYRSLKHNLELAFLYCSKQAFTEFIMQLEFMLSAINNYCNNTNYINISYNLRTRLYLQLHAIKVLALASYPVLTNLSKQILLFLKQDIKKIEAAKITLTPFKNIDLKQLLNFIKENYS